MQLLIVLLIVQILFAGTILNTSTNSKQAVVVRHTLKKVLGASTFLAQDDSSPDQSPSDQSTSPSNDQGQPTTQPNDSSQTTPPSEQTPPRDQITTAPAEQTTEPIPTAAPTPAKTFDVNSQQNPSQNSTSNSPDTSLLEEVTPTAFPSAEPQSELISPSPTSSENASTFPDTTALTATSPDLINSSASVAVTDPSSLIANPQQIDETVMQKAKEEDQVLAQPHTPQQAATTLISFAKDKVIGIDTSLKTNDFATSSFLTQRLNEQLDQATQAVNNVSSPQTVQAKQSLQAFCKQADLALKTEQISVPEDLEQDVIIVRGKCLDITQ